MDASTIIVEIKNLQKSFGTNHVLNNISLKVSRGENLVVMGKSGSGKSVLIKCLIGLLKPEEGSINLFNEDMLTLNDLELNILRKKVGFLFQSAALYDSMSVRGNLEFPLRDSKEMTKEEINVRVEEVLKNVGLENAINYMPLELSGGMRKRVGLARALMLKPELILYDEPTTGLDPITAKEISRLMVDVQHKFNTASIIITHDIECARITANRIIIIKDGLLYAEGTFADLTDSKDEWVKSFFS